MIRHRGIGLAAALLVVVLLLGSAPNAIALHASPSARHSGSTGPVPSRPSRAVAIVPSAPQAGANGRLIVSPSDPKIVPNDGLRTNITAFGYLPIDPNSSFQIGVEEVIGTYEAVFGLFDNYALGQVPFFDVFSNQSVRSSHLAYGTSPAVSGSAYEFDLTSSGGPVWTLRVNGALLGGSQNNSSFDFGVANATWAGGAGFSEIGLFQNASDIPALVTTTVAFEFLEPSGWYLPVGAKAVDSGGTTTEWGVEGRVQHATLAPDEIRSGTAIATVGNGTMLWATGAVAVSVGLSLWATSVVATMPDTATVVIREVGSLPVPGVPFLLTDRLVGPLLPSWVETGPNGSFTVPFLTPNVSGAADDLVSVTVVIPGYVGSAGIGLMLAPPSELSISYSGSVPSVALNASASLSFLVSNSSGAAVGGVLVDFDSGAGGALASGSAITTPSGLASIGFTAGPMPATVQVEARVAQPGFWGHTTIVVAVVRAAPTLLSEAEPWIGLGVVVAVLAIPVVLVLSRWRERPTIPELHLGGATGAGLSDSPPSQGKGEPARRPPG
jgi:hypothetical protein